MPRLTLTRSYHFNAGHRLFDPARDDAWNERVYGKCSYPDGHGHNYELEVTLAGVPSPETGAIYPLDVLDRCVEECVLERFDHRSLNRELDLTDGVAPTSEVFIVEIWRILARELEPHAGLRHIRLWETPRNVFDYDGRGAPVPRVSPRGD